jgi:hypothetical protein
MPMHFRREAAYCHRRVPFLNDFTHRIRGKAIFSTIDLTKAYHQIPINEADIAKAAISTPFGLFEFEKMTFGQGRDTDAMNNVPNQVF